jgi:hypothetical protein
MIPDKEVIVPNQKSWTEMAEHMGIKQAPKCKWLPEECGLTEQSISATKGKCICVYSDPYARGKRSGKHAKPDALSAVVNAHAHASVHPSSPASQPLPVTALTFMFTSASQPLPTMAPMFTLAPASQQLPATMNIYSYMHASLSSLCMAPLLSQFNHGKCPTCHMQLRQLHALALT